MEYQANKDNHQQDFLGSGSYGCVYYPGFNCRGKFNKNKNYVTKIQVNSRATKNEIEMSKTIKSLIPNYSHYFNVIYKNCSTNLNKIENADEISKCDAIYDHLSMSSDNTKKNNIVLTYNRKIDGVTIKKLSKQVFKLDYDDGYIIKLIHSIYLKLNKSLQILLTANIVHNDLHHSNIMIRERDNKPIIIDFGLAYHKTDKFIKTFDNMLYSSNFRPEREHDNLDKHIIRFIIEKINDRDRDRDMSYLSTIVNYDKIKNFLDKDLIQEFKLEIENYLLTTLYQELPGNNEKALQYLTQAIDRYLYKYTDLNKYKSIYDIFYEIYNNSVFSIDKYSINFMLLEFLSNNKTIIGDNHYFSDYFNFFKQLYIIQLNPNLEETLTYNQVINYINYIIEQIKKINLSSLDDYKLISDIKKYCDKNKISNILDLYDIDYSYLLNSQIIKLIKQL
tara:strand:+ start:453 stop:1796 length:1344 start_codon:yes stop_codon:yes gene_type:complete